MLHLLAYGNIGRAEAAAETPNLASFLARVHTVLTILSSKFSGLSEYRNLIKSVQLAFTSSSEDIHPNIDFLARTDHYAFYKFVLESVGITPASGSADSYVQYQPR